MTSYQEFIAQKAYTHIEAGFVAGDMPWPLKDFQRDCVAWACRRGRAAIFADPDIILCVPTNVR